MTPLIALTTLSLLGYHLTFDFEMTAPSDMSQFINTFANGDTTLYGNKEAESYVPYQPASSTTPFVFTNGALTINALLITTYNEPYTSGLLETSGIFTQSSGYFEIRAETPAAPGFWPAFWLLPAAYYPEIDILEQPNNSGSNTQYWTHTSTPSDSSGGFTDTGVDVTKGFHRYGFLWTANSIQYVFDGTLVGDPHVLPPSMVGLQMYLVANLAVGGVGSWPGPPPAGATSSYTIDYIRAFSNDPTVPTVSQEPISSPDLVDTTPVLLPPTPPVPAPIVHPGADTLVLNMAEDAYEGDAQFSVSVDGHQIGGTLTAQANHAFNQTQPFTLHGNFGQAKHQVSVNFLNNFGDLGGDRNLYMTSATINGHPIVGAVINAYGGGAQSFAFQNKPVQPVTIGTGPDTLLFNLSATPVTANARFTLAVDGVVQGTPQVVAALHNLGQTQSFAVQGSFGPGAHKVTLSFLSGAPAQTTRQTVQLYIDALSYNGLAVPNAVASFGKSGKYAIYTPLQQADTLTLSLTEDSWQGDAMAQISVDGQVLGVVTVTANNYYGAPQMVSYSGAWGGPNVAHVVEVNFLNDAYAGSGTDRNLHVGNITLDGTSITSQPQNLMRGGPVDFNYLTPTASAGWTQAAAKSS